MPLKEAIAELHEQPKIDIFTDLKSQRSNDAPRSMYPPDGRGRLKLTQ